MAGGRAGRRRGHDGYVAIATVDKDWGLMEQGAGAGMAGFRVARSSLLLFVAFDGPAAGDQASDNLPTCSVVGRDG